MLESQISINSFGEHCVEEINKIMFLCSSSEGSSSTCPGVHNVPHRSMCKMLKSCHQNLRKISYKLQ